jgi:putative membrane protein
MTTRYARPAAGIKHDARSAVSVGDSVTASVTRDSFVRLAANAVVYELEAADLALERARHQEIKGFAREMLADFEKIGHELKSFCRDADSRSPADNLDPSFQSLLDDLYGASDADFDERYVAQMRSTHSAAIALFKSYRRTSGDGGLTRLCGAEVSVLEHHLAMADELSDLL